MLVLEFTFSLVVQAQGQYNLCWTNCLSLCKAKSQSQSQSQRLPRSSLPAADLTAEMETMAQRRSSMDDSFHLPNFPHMAWVDPSALPAIVIMPSLRARFECIYCIVFITLSSSSASPIHVVTHEDDT